MARKLVSYLVLNSYLYRMAKIGYILKQDIVTHLQGDTLDELTGARFIGSEINASGNDNIWIMQLPPSIEKMLGYTRHWYDMDKEVRSILSFIDTDTHKVDDRVRGVIENDIGPLYLCIKDAPAGTALDNAEFFELKDNRNPVLIEIVCLMLIYNLSRRGNPRQIPEQRQVDYDRSIDMLKDIQKGRVQLSIAAREVIAEDDPGQEIAFGTFEGLTQSVY